MTHQEMAKVVVDALDRGDHRATWLLIQLSMRTGVSPDVCLGRIRQMSDGTYDYEKEQA